MIIGARPRMPKGGAVPALALATPAAAAPA